MNYGERLVTPPAEEPLSLEEALLYVRQDHTADSAVILRQIKAARERCERVTGRQLVTATWRIILDAFPGGSGSLLLPHPPLVSVASVQYVDLAGETQTLSAAAYSADTGREPGWLLPAYGYSWPATYDQANAVTIDYVAGYGTASQVPAEVREALARCVAHTYGNRGLTDEDALDRLFRSLWHGEFC